jgi:MFS family permease
VIFNRYGYLQTTYSVLQLLGAPIVGVIGDKYGTKYALIVSFGSSAINYFLLGKKF